jgi:hypothetical protein
MIYPVQYQALGIARRFPEDEKANDICFACNLGLAQIGARLCMWWIPPPRFSPLPFRLPSFFPSLPRSSHLGNAFLIFCCRHDEVDQLAGRRRDKQNSGQNG